MTKINLAQLAYLVVEDDAPTRQILSVLLTKTIGSNRVALLEDSEAFDEKLAALIPPPDLILLDIAIKPYSGYEMLELIRERDAFRNAKVVAITAHVMREEVDKIRAAGFDGMIGKPFIRQIFSELIQRLMQGESVWYIA
jgi:two-component system, cell cycle response regulator DivK